MGVLAVPQLRSSPPAPAEMPMAGPKQGLAVLGHVGQLALGGILVFFLTAALERPQRLYVLLRKCLLTSSASPSSFPSSETKCASALLFPPRWGSAA